MNDNKSAHMASEYDEKIKATIPNYGFLHTETIDLVKAINPEPEKWLDTGCGTGNFVISARRAFKDTSFVLGDPSGEMLKIAGSKLSDLEKIKILEPVSSQNINLPENSFDVLTAIQSHHYLDLDERKAATKNCFRMLKPGGVFIAFENIRPLTDVGTNIGLKRWKSFQMLGGKSADEAEKHVMRFGKEFFPITTVDYLELLRETGFSDVELFWFSYMQAGFYAIKK